MDMKLRIYDKTGKTLEKTYTATQFDLMWGTMEDLVQCVDLDKVDDKAAVGGMILKLLPQLKPLLMQIFEGVTEEEIRRTKVSELVPIFIQASIPKSHRNAPPQCRPSGFPSAPHLQKVFQNMFHLSGVPITRL